MLMEKIILPPGAYVLKNYFYLIQQKYIDYPRISLIDKDKYNYIVIEGIDGAGKTTISQLVVSELKKKGIDSEFVYEPFTDEIKNLLNKNPDIPPFVEAMLFAADRLYLHSKIISELLRNNKVVVSDRSFVASLVYQVARGAPEEFVYSINNFAIKPSIIILLDISPNVAIERLKRKKTKQLLHLEQPSYFDSIRKRYFDVLGKIGIPYHVINAEKEVNSVLNEVLNIVLQNLV